MSYELRPLTLAEILDAGFRLVQTEWRTLVGLSMIAQLPFVAIGLRADWLFDPFSRPFEPGEELSRSVLVEMGLLGSGLGLTYLLLYPFVAAAVTASVGNFYLGRRFELRDAARAGLRSLLRLIGSYLVWGLVSFGISIVLFGGIALVVVVFGAVVGNPMETLGGLGLLLTVLLGLVAFVAVVAVMLFVGCVASIVPPVAVLESVGVVRTVARAWELASAAKARTVGVVFTAGLIVGFPIFGAQMMIGFVPYVGLLIWAAFQAVGFAFTTAVAVVLYFDLRCRAEHFDLELLAGQVEAGPGLGRG